MAELTTRPCRSGDAAAITDLINLIEKSAGGHPGFTKDVISSFLAELEDLDLNSRLVLTADGAMVGYALVLVPPPDGFRVDLWGGVYPDWRGRGIGRELLAFQLDRAAQLHDLTS